MIQSTPLSQLASGRWEEIALALAGNQFTAAIEARDRKQVPCPVCGGKTRFTTFKDFNERGSCYCVQCGSQSGGVNSLAWALGLEPKEVCRKIYQYLDDICSTPFQPRIRRKKPEPVRLTPNPKARQSIQRVLSGSQEPNHEIVQLYFKNRGFKQTPHLSESYRFHPSLPYYCPDKERVIFRAPALLSLLTDKKGGLVTIHRTYLTANGYKERCAKPKKVMMPAIDSGLSYLSVAVRHEQPRGQTLGVCEGIELSHAVRSRTAYPVWPTYCGSQLAKFIPPAGIKHLVIWGDCDSQGAGQTYAAKLAIKAQKQGLKVSIRLPVKANEAVPVRPNNDDIVSVLERHGYRVIPTKKGNDQTRPDWEDIILSGGL